MKKVKCSYKGCGDRRAHYETPEKKRKCVIITVPDDYDGPKYCSIECAVYDGAYSVTKGWLITDKNGNKIQG